MGYMKLITGALLLIFFSTIVTSRFHGRSYKAYPTRGYIPKATPTPECKDTITCGSAEFVAKCVTCRPEYFYCTSPGAPPIVKECGSGLVFNPDRNYPRCVLKDNCPYHPPWTLPTTAPPPTTTPATTAPATTAPATTAASTAPGDSTTLAASTESGASTDSGASTTPGASTTGAATSATTSAAVTTTTPAAPTTTSECVDTLTCPAQGFFAQCVTCQPNYFQCTAKDTPGILRQCSSGMVFNTDPAFPRCVLEANCPYHPSL